jgi:hypothetical protein
MQIDYILFANICKRNIIQKQLLAYCKKLPFVSKPILKRGDFFQDEIALPIFYNFDAFGGNTGRLRGAAANRGGNRRSKKGNSRR